MSEPKWFSLARFMFDRQADSYDSDPAMRELAWADSDIRKFWETEAQAILLELGFCPTDMESMPCPTCGAGL